MMANRNSTLVLLLTGNPAARPALIDFANNITMGRSLLICGFVIPQSTSSSAAVITKKVHRQMSEWLESRNVEAFAATVANKHQVEGAITLLQSSGIGKMRPNILMIGFKTNWEKRGVDEIIGFYEIVLNSRNAFENDVGVAIFRNSNIGFDLTERFNDGGLTVLLPYLLQLPGTYLEGARLRVFIEGGTSDRVSNDQKNMAALLRKFGLKSSDLIVISTLDRFPNKATFVLQTFSNFSLRVILRPFFRVDDFEELISAFKGNENGWHGVITNVRLMFLQ
uniref:SLC12 domain-containing protein n=1 Tax=Angiostrongylus cantonensis TaxID=6313 RepID=A0A158PCA4_ANGCA